MSRYSTPAITMALAAIVAVGAACGAGTESGTTVEAMKSAPSATASVVPVVAELRLDPLPLPGPGPRVRVEGTDMEAVNATCERCHAEIAREWRASLHQGAYDDPVFLSAYSIEPTPFCFNCHAPERRDARHLGVACTTCHLQGSEIVGSRGVGGDAHATRQDARLATVEACSNCHQFEFPNLAGAFMQSTVDEHAASNARAQTCQDCHMPEVAAPAGGRPHKSHSFAVQSNPELMRSAIEVKAERAGDRFVQLTISTTPAIGHSFPTGDLFRRLEVRAEVLGPDGSVASTSNIKHLGRTYEVRMDPETKTTVRVPRSDSRIPAPGAGEARHAVVRFPEDVTGRTVRWTVAYQRMDDGLARLFGIDPRADERVVAQGVLP
ncbi:MAG: cytochrome c3 family protein [Polyangiaceae bacterium]